MLKKNFNVTLHIFFLPGVAQRFTKLFKLKQKKMLVGSIELKYRNKYMK